MSSLSADVRVTRPGHTLQVALTAEPGEIIAVAGPNGAGKTTLLRALAGTVPTDGSVCVGDADWSGLPSHLRRVGLVHQEHALFPHLTALQNVAFGPRARGARRTAAERRAQDLLDQLGVGDLAGRRPDQLSGGQSQRVALARALATEPDLLLLDEPFAALDVAVGQALREQLAAHLAEFSGVTLLVTHDAVDVFTLAHRLLVLDDGSVAQLGTPDEVAARPGSAHAARLVGRNVLRGTASGTDVRLTDGEPLVTAHAAEGPVLVTFSPTAVTLNSAQPTGSARNRWHAVVRRVTPTDDVLRVQLEHPDLVADITPGAAEELGLEPGSRVWASVKATEVTVIAAGTTTPR
jgi:molybdate transport system ATP-binding protein